MKSPAVRPRSGATWRDRLVEEGKLECRITDSELLDLACGDLYRTRLKRSTVYLDPATGNSLQLHGAYYRAEAALDEGLEVWEAYS